MNASTYKGLPGMVYDSLKCLLMSYEHRMDIVVHTGDCYYLEFPRTTAARQRFFAAVQKKDDRTVLRLQWLLQNAGVSGMLSHRLLPLWDGGHSFVFNDLPEEVLPEIQRLLELSMTQGYNSISGIG